MRKSTWGLWGFLLLLSIITSVFLFVVLLQPYAQARSLVDSFSKDGSMDSFSQALYEVARLPLLALAGVLAISDVLMGVYRERVLGWIAVCQALPRRAWLDLRSLLADLHAEKIGRSEWAGLFGLVLLALVARLPFVLRPYYHDEAYTVITFAIQPFHALVADYTLPNNHIFHTILVRLIYLIWGIQPWAMRLPALLAGILCVPAIYFLARRLYHPFTAIVAAAAVATLPVLVKFSTAARGYTLVMLFAILCFLLADYVRKKANLAAWCGLIVCSVLGLYTIPVFMAPFGAVMLWLFLSMLVGDFGADYSRKKLLGWLTAAGLGVAFLTALLYLPVFLRSGLQTDFTKKIVDPLSWQTFFITMLSRLEGHAGELLTDLPPIAGWLIWVGCCLSLVFALLPGLSPAFKPLKIPNQVAVLGWTIGLYALLRVPPETRLIIFLVPFWLLWAVAGWVGLFALLSSKVRRVSLTAVFTGLVVVVAVLGTGWQLAHDPEANFRYRGNLENVAIFLESQIRESDLIVVNNPNDAATWYYTRLHGISFDHFRRELPFFRAFILVDSQFDQTLESVMAERGPEAFFFDYSTAQVVYQSGSVQVVELIPYEALIRSQYHLP